MRNRKVEKIWKFYSERKMRLHLSTCLNLQVTCVSNIEKILKVALFLHLSSEFPPFIPKTIYPVQCTSRIFLHIRIIIIINLVTPS